MKVEKLFSGANSGNVVNFPKEDLLNAVNPNGFQLYFLYDAWRMALINSDTKKRIAMKLLATTSDKAGIDVPKNIQIAAQALNDAAKVLNVDPADVKALATTKKNAPIVAAWIGETFDSEDNYVYAGEKENADGKMITWISLSPNAPGENTGIATVEMTSALVGA
jgi:hypothetical protein